jgi:hypothetical protein
LSRKYQLSRISLKFDCWMSSCAATTNCHELDDRSRRELRLKHACHYKHKTLPKSPSRIIQIRKVVFSLLFICLIDVNPKSIFPRSARNPAIAASLRAAFLNRPGQDSTQCRHLENAIAYLSADRVYKASFLYSHTYPHLTCIIFPNRDYWNDTALSMIYRTKKE